MLLEVQTDLKQHHVRIESAAGRTVSQNLQDAEWHLRMALEAIENEIAD